MIKTETFDWLQEPFEGFLYTSKYVVASMASASSSPNVEINLKLFDMMKLREIDYANPSCTNIIFSLSLKSLSRDGLWHPLNTATNGSQIRLEIDKSWVFFFFFCCYCCCCCCCCCWFFAKTQNSINWPTVKTAIDSAVEETKTRLF